MNVSDLGMFDGNVAVYNLETNSTQPMYVSRGTDGKHSNIVWEVKWGVDMQDGELNFYSIAADGIIYNWVLMQSQLSLTTITTLFVDQEISAGPDGNTVKLKGFILYIGITPLMQMILNHMNFSLWHLHGIPSKIAEYFLGRIGRRSNIQM